MDPLPLLVQQGTTKIPILNVTIIWKKDHFTVWQYDNINDNI